MQVMDAVLAVVQKEDIVCNWTAIDPSFLIQCVIHLVLEPHNEGAIKAI